MVWRPRSVRARYSLRALLVFITLFMLWGGYHTNRSWKERQAEEILRQRGATFGYGQYPTKGNVAERLIGAYWRFAGTLWGERNITIVHYQGSLDAKAADALLSLPSLKSLYLSSSPQRTSEENYRLLKSLKPWPATAKLPPGFLREIIAKCEPTNLDLQEWVLSDDECQALADRHVLLPVSLCGCAISEENLAKLITQPGRQSLNFAYCDVTGSALKGHPGSPTLEHLHSSGTRVGHDFARFIAKCPRIKELAADHQGVDDAFVELLGPHPSLRAISLQNSRVTEKCFSDIQRMPAVELVIFPRETISREALMRLRTAQPKIVAGHQ